MPALIPTAFEGRVLWLGHVPHRDRAEIETVAMDEMPLGFGGFAGDCHAGETRASCSRVTRQYPRGTTIRNVRQVSLVAAEDLARIAEALGLERVAPGMGRCVGRGRGHSGLQPPAAILAVAGAGRRDADRRHAEPALPVSREDHRGRASRQGQAVQGGGRGLRGVTAWVERVGTLRIGDALRLHVPDQRPWAHLDAARGCDPSRAASHRARINDVDVRRAQI
jgi:hypothetical protein